MTTPRRRTAPADVAGRVVGIVLTVLVGGSDLLGGSRRACRPRRTRGRRPRTTSRSTRRADYARLLSADTDVPADPAVDAQHRRRVRAGHDRHRGARDPAALRLRPAAVPRPATSSSTRCSPPWRSPPTPTLDPALPDHEPASGWSTPTPASCSSTSRASCRWRPGSCTTTSPASRSIEEAGPDRRGRPGCRCSGTCCCRSPGPGSSRPRLITFLFAWAQFLFPLVLSSDISTQPLTVVIASLQGRHVVPSTLLNAAGVLAIVVPAALAAGLQPLHRQRAAGRQHREPEGRPAMTPTRTPGLADRDGPDRSAGRGGAGPVEPAGRSC